MAKKKIFKVIKLSLPKNEQPLNYEPSFPKMPILYLEFLENKDKIKPSLVTIPYNPDNVNSLDLKIHNNNETNNKIAPPESKKNHIDVKTPTEKLDVDKLKNIIDNNSNIVENIDLEDDIDNKQNNIKFDKQDKYNDNDDADIDNESINSNDSDAIGKRLKELLGSEKNKDKYNNNNNNISNNNNNNISNNNNNNNNISNNNNPIKPPTFEELQKQGAIPMKKQYDVKYMNEYEEDDKKRELLFKFELLKKSYPTSNLPEYTIHSDYMMMLKDYERNVKRLSVDSNVDKYKQYLIFGFMGVEYILGTFLGFDMSGFTQQQILSMNSYEKLLIELGEKTYVPDSKWPVELRLLFLVVINAAFFIVSKIIFSKTGSNILNMMNTMNIDNNKDDGNKKKMKRPNVNLDDLQ